MKNFFAKLVALSKVIVDFFRTHIIFDLSVLFFGLLLLINTLDAKFEQTGLFVPLIISFIGAILFYRSIKIDNRNWILFLSILLLGHGVLLILIHARLVSYSIAELWPLTVIFSGLALITAGYHKLQRIHPVYFVPSLALIFLGSVFFCFSFFIEESFVSLFMNWLPLLLFVSLLFLIVLFLLRKDVKKSEETDE